MSGKQATINTCWIDARSGAHSVHTHLLECNHFYSRSRMRCCVLAQRGNSESGIDREPVGRHTCWENWCIKGLVSGVSGYQHRLWGSTISPITLLSVLERAFQFLKATVSLQSHYASKGRTGIHIFICNIFQHCSFHVYLLVLFNAISHISLRPFQLSSANMQCYLLIIIIPMQYAHYKQNCSHAIQLRCFSMAIKLSVLTKICIQHFLSWPLFKINKTYCIFHKLKGQLMVVCTCLLKDESKRDSHLECEITTAMNLLIFSWHIIKSYSKHCIQTDFICKTHIKINNIFLKCKKHKYRFMVNV